MGQSSSRFPDGYPRSLRPRMRILKHGRPDPYKGWVPDQTTRTRIVRVYLARLGLPPELIVLVLDAANYYPVEHVSMPGNTSCTARPCPRGTHCAASPSFGFGFYPRKAPGETVRVRKVALTAYMRSKGPTDGLPPGAPPGSHAWLDVVIVRRATSDATRVIDDRALWDREGHEICSPFDVEVDRASLPPERQQWRTNVHVRNGAAPDPDGNPSASWLVCRDTDPDWENGSTYSVVWNTTGEVESIINGKRGCGTGEGFVQALRPGDMIEWWVGAQYPGSECHVRGFMMEILYDVQ